MVIKQKKSKKNKGLDCICSIEGTGQFDCNRQKGLIKTKKCVCVRSEGNKKELKGIGRVNLTLE